MLYHAQGDDSRTVLHWLRSIFLKLQRFFACVRWRFPKGGVAIRFMPPSKTSFGTTDVNRLASAPVAASGYPEESLEIGESGERPSTASDCPYSRLRHKIKPSIDTSSPGMTSPASQRQSGRRKLTTTLNSLIGPECPLPPWPVDTALEAKPASMIIQNKPRRTPSPRDPLETQRLWIVAASWTLLWAAFVLLLLKAPWVSLIVGVPVLLPFLWLFSLHLVGQKPPTSLLRLDIAGFARHVLGETKAAVFRALNAVPASGGSHLPTTQAVGRDLSL